MDDLKKNIAGIDIPENILRIIKSANTDGSISSIKEVLKRESLSLATKTNQTFKELCQTLDNEQSRLITLENKRKRLLEEMLQLKDDINKERESCQLDLEAANISNEHMEADKFDNTSDLVELDDDDEVRTIYPRNPNNFNQPSRNEFHNYDDDSHRMLKSFDTNRRN